MIGGDVSGQRRPRPDVQQWRGEHGDEEGLPLAAAGWSSTSPRGRGRRRRRHRLDRIRRRFFLDPILALARHLFARGCGIASRPQARHDTHGAVADAPARRACPGGRTAGRAQDAVSHDCPRPASARRIEEEGHGHPDFQSPEYRRCRVPSHCDLLAPRPNRDLGSSARSPRRCRKRRATAVTRAEVVGCLRGLQPDTSHEMLPAALRDRQRFLAADFRPCRAAASRDAEPRSCERR
jgi:hypothetical protein